MQLHSPSLYIDGLSRDVRGGVAWKGIRGNEIQYKFFIHLIILFIKTFLITIIVLCKYILNT